MHARNQAAPARSGPAGLRPPLSVAPALAIASFLLSACSVYDIRPDIDPLASRDGGIRYEEDLKLCQDEAAERSSGPNEGLAVLAAVSAVSTGAAVGGGGATLFHGNVRNATGMGALVGATAGFNGLAETMATNPGIDARTRIQVCLMESGYTVVWGAGFRMPAFDPPLRP
ncbi:hypothetical protein KXS07_25040 [Inquilinus limosus]|uniref:hypothetical protein n=1 Tax=Inquilinus limosus TaxID=171674 RepID=UPI003F189A15